jgi:uncharacterized protein (DUF2336 family)
MAESSRLLTDLTTLAREPSSERRRELLERLTDLFLREPEVPPATGDLFADVAARVARETDVNGRQALSQRLAEVGVAPHRLVLMLAQDVIAVAEPILRRSGVLNEGDLLSLTASMGQDHLKAIAQRSTISEQVVDALIAKGDDRVLVSVARNPGASLSRNAMAQLVARSERCEGLHEPLVLRRELPPDLLHEMFWWVSSALRQRIVERAELDPEAFERSMAEAQAGFAQRLQSRREEESRAERLMRREQRLGKLNEQYLLQLLRQELLTEFVIGFGLVAEIDLATARRVIEDPSREALAVACRACGFDRGTFATMALLATGGPRQVRKASDVAALLALYDKLPEEPAKRTMRFWRVRCLAQRGAAAA